MHGGKLGAGSSKGKHFGEEIQGFKHHHRGYRREGSIHSRQGGMGGRGSYTKTVRGGDGRGKGRDQQDMQELRFYLRESRGPFRRRSRHRCRCGQNSFSTPSLNHEQLHRIRLRSTPFLRTKVYTMTALCAEDTQKRVLALLVYTICSNIRKKKKKKNDD